MLCCGEEEIKVCVYLCGNERQCLAQVLRPGSLVLLGGRKRWWRSAEEKLAGFLESLGHRVLFVNAAASDPAGVERGK